MGRDPGLHRTKFAAQGASIANQFTAMMSKYPVGAHRAEMTAPEGSTGGGVQALQHIRLVAPPGSSGKTYVVGNANAAGRSAELRTLEYVDQVSQERFGERTGFDPAAYQSFAGGAANFLQAMGLIVTHVAVPVVEARPATAAGPSRVALVAWTGFVFLLGGAVGVLATRLGWVR